MDKNFSHIEKEQALIIMHAHINIKTKPMLWLENIEIHSL